MIHETYLLSVKALLTQKYHNELVSLILFGSMLGNKGKGKSSTDIDLIIVIRDSCPKNTRLQLQKELFGLQQEYIIDEPEFKDIFIRGLQSATGMFINSFLCTYSDIQGRIFHKTFGVNRIIAFILAPQSSVWLSLKERHRILIGRDVIQEWENEILFEPNDIIRSCIMNCLLSVGALCLSVLKVDMTHFSMEAVKWSLFTWKNRKNKATSQLEVLCRNYAHIGSKIERQVLSAFLEYRSNLKPNKYLVLLAPIFIFKLHNRLGKGS